jgi:CAAX protease family protein
MIDEDVETEVETKPFRFTILHAAGLIVLFVSLQLWVSFLLTHSDAPFLMDNDGWPHISIANGIAGFLTVAAGAVLIGFSARDIGQSVRFKLSALIPVVCCALGMAILSSELSNLLQSIQPISEDYSKLYDSLMKQNLAGLLLAVAFVAPVTEELIFRGVIQDGLRLSYRTHTAVLTSAILFGLVHGLPWLMINAFLLGLFFSWLRLRTDSLGPGIVTHSLYNAVPFVLTKFFKFEIPGLTTLSGDKVTFQPIWLDFLGALLLVAGIFAVRALFKPAETEKVAPAVENVV